MALEFMTVPEAARVLGYSVQHTRLLLRQGKLRGDKRGRDWLVLREAVFDFKLRRGTIPLSLKGIRKLSPKRGLISIP